MNKLKPYIIRLLVVALLVGSFFLGTRFMGKKTIRIDAPLEVTVTHQKPIPDYQDARTGRFYIETFTGVIDDGEIVWNGAIPEIYPKVIMYSDTRADIYIYNNSLETIMISRQHQTMIKTNDYWKEIPNSDLILSDDFPGIIAKPYTYATFTTTKRFPTRTDYRIGLFCQPIDESSTEWWYLTYDIRVTW